MFDLIATEDPKEALIFDLIEPPEGRSGDWPKTESGKRALALMINGRHNLEKFSSNKNALSVLNSSIISQFCEILGVESVALYAYGAWATAYEKARENAGPA